MMAWFSVEERLPKEDEFTWVNIKTKGKERGHKCKVWENEGETSFVNILFEKEQNVTHWRGVETKD